MNVLVTGSEGFIGSHLVERLAHLGHKVRCLVMYNFAGSIGWLERLSHEVKGQIEIVFGDVQDANQMAAIAKGQEQIFHLAALIGIPYSYTAVESYLRTNVVGTMNLLNAARQHEIARFIQTSTSEVYGSAQFTPMDESHPQVGQSPYAASKIAADQLALSYWHSFETPVTILRPFNTYGPRQSERAIVPTIISQALNPNSCEIQVGDITTTRDLTYVSDTVEGFLAASTAPQAVGKSINLGTGFATTIAQLIETIGKIVGKDLVPVASAERFRPRKSEVQALLSDNSMARELLGWAPEFYGNLGLEKGLHKTVDWWEEEFNSQPYGNPGFRV